MELSRTERAPNVKRARARAYNQVISNTYNRIMKNEMFHRNIRDDQFRYKRKQMCEMVLTHEILNRYRHKSNIFCENLLELQGSPEKNLIHIFPRHFFLCETT